MNSFQPTYVQAVGDVDGDHVEQAASMFVHTSHRGIVSLFLQQCQGQLTLPSLESCLVKKGKSTEIGESLVKTETYDNGRRSKEATERNSQGRSVRIQVTEVEPRRNQNHDGPQPLSRVICACAIAMNKNSNSKCSDFMK